MKTTILDVDDENDGTSPKVIVNQWLVVLLLNMFEKTRVSTADPKMSHERTQNRNDAGVDEDDDPRRRRRERRDLDESDLNQ